MIKKHYAEPSNHRRLPAAVKGKLGATPRKPGLPLKTKPKYQPPYPKPTQYPKGHPSSPTLAQDRLDTLNNFYNSIPNRLDAFDNKENPFKEADPVIPDSEYKNLNSGKPKFGLFELPW